LSPSGERVGVVGEDLGEFGEKPPSFPISPVHVGDCTGRLLLGHGTYEHEHLLAGTV
jgi:hypothetical protein